MATSEELVARFLRETLAIAASVEVDERSIQELGQVAATKQHSERRAALTSYFDLLEPYRDRKDFQFLRSLPRPTPLDLHIEETILYGHFRSWLRKLAIDPDTIDAGTDYWGS